jgi:3-oxoacyl-[acyl-carrier protein] reductase
MDLGLSGRVGVVAASSKGLGLGVARALAEEGVALVVNARSEAELEAAAAELRAGGATVIAHPGDVSDPELPAVLVARAVEEFGRLDIVVSNAGGPPPAKSLELTDEAIAAALQSSLLSHVRFVRAAIPHMEANHWGRICAIASFTVAQAIPNLAASTLARTALRAWAKTAAQDLVASGITLNLIAPGLHLTDRIRQLGDVAGHIGDPADFGRIVTFLCSEPANFINGATILVDGGSTLAL